MLLFIRIYDDIIRHIWETCLARAKRARWTQVLARDFKEREAGGALNNIYKYGPFMSINVYSLWVENTPRARKASTLDTDIGAPPIRRKRGGWTS